MIRHSAQGIPIPWHGYAVRLKFSTSTNKPREALLADNLAVTSSQKVKRRGSQR
jgi:hypothetical protein